MNRRYFRSSIHDLETLFENQKDNGSLLTVLEDELEHRKTERAANLRRRVVMRLTELGISCAPPTQKQQALWIGSASNKESDGIIHTVADTSKGTQKTADNADFSSATMRERIKNHSQRAIPPVINKPESILSAWTALEVLSPHPFRRPEDLASGDRTRVAKLDGLQLPWQRGDKSRPNYRLFYQVVLGAIRMAPAMELLVEHYGDTRIEKPSVVGNAALAVVIVDKQGCLVEAPAVAVSSFGWGVMTALDGELEDLAQWPKVESQLAARIEKILQNRTDDVDRNQPITRAALISAYQDLITSWGLPVDWLEPPTICDSHVHVLQRSKPARAHTA
jgi:hypothetical protein